MPLLADQTSKMRAFPVAAPQAQMMYPPAPVTTMPSPSVPMQPMPMPFGFVPQVPASWRAESLGRDAPTRTIRKRTSPRSLRAAWLFAASLAVGAFVIAFLVYEILIHLLP
jgi:hypothetical protein